MKKSSLKLLNKIVRKSSGYVDKLNKKLSEQLSEEGELFTIVDKFDLGKSVFCIKSESIEKVRPFNIYGILRNIQLEVEYPSLDLMEYKNVQIYPESDFIISGEKVIWNKKNYPMFSKMYPLDKDLVSFNNSQVRILNSKEIVSTQTAFSLCGVHATIWSHFIVQYLPKIYFFQQFAARLTENITIVLPEYSDKHVIEVVNYYLSRFKNYTVLVLKNNQSLYCEKLYYIESTSMISDHETYETYIDFFVPDCVTSFLKTDFVPSCLKIYNIQDFGQKNKIYIVRKNAAYRNLLNIEEIENFFKNEGFTFIEPHLLTMKEKIELFFNASEIAGPYSAGFSNIQFCRKGTKICLLSNIQRSFEAYLSYFVDQNEIDFFAVTGTDITNDSHSSYTISIDKVKKAYLDIFKNQQTKS